MEQNLVSSSENPLLYERFFTFFFKDSTSHYAQKCVDTCPILFEVNRATSRAVTVFGYHNAKKLERNKRQSESCICSK